MPRLIAPIFDLSPLPDQKNRLSADQEVNMQRFTASPLLVLSCHRNNDFVWRLEEESTQSMAKYPGFGENDFVVMWLL
jgi:hypothetical protein